MVRKGKEMDLDAMIKRIAVEGELGEGEIRKRIDEKRDELGGLITHEGAAHIIARELGLSLFQSQRPGQSLKIADITAGMNNVDTVGRVVRVHQPKEYAKKNGNTGAVASVILGDDTGRIRVIFWDQCSSVLGEGKIRESDVLSIRGGYSRNNKEGEVEVHLNMRSRVAANPTDVAIGDVPTPTSGLNISKLREGMKNVDVLCKVLRIQEAKEFETKEGSKGKVANLEVADESGRARLVLWGEDVGLVESGGIKEGDVLRVERAYVKARFGGMEINASRYGKISVNPPGVALDVDARHYSTARKDLKDLKAGDTAVVRGAVMELYAPRIFQRKKGKGIVVNAAIDDGTACMRAAFYDRNAEALLDKPAAELAEEQGAAERLDQRKKELLGKEILATVEVRRSEFSGEEELVVLDLNLNPDPKEIIRELLEEAKSREGI